MKAFIPSALFLLSACLYASQVSITIRPFAISFGRPMLGIGYLLFGIGMVLIITDTRIEAVKETTDKIIQLIEKK